MSEISDNLASIIKRFLAEQGELSAGEAVNFELLSGGNSHITWRVRTAPERADMVIKVAQPDGPLAPYDVAHEASMMSTAYGSGVPAPELIGVLQQGELQFIAMRHVEGDAPSLWEVRQWLDGQSEDTRLSIGRSLLGVLPRLSAIRPDNSVDLVERYSYYLNSLQHQVEEALSGHLSVPPVLPKAHKWLEERLEFIEGSEAALHHGDFRLGNVVFGANSVAAVLDWERAMFGHPVHDLGYLSLPGMQNGGLIGGVLRQQEIEEIWRSQTGEDLDIRLVSYFRNMSMFSELCYMLRAMGRLGQGKGRLSGLRPLPLIAELHLDLISGIQRWNDGDFNI